MSEKTVPSTFEEVVTAHPDRPAVISFEGKVTYRELDERANLIAFNLIKHGVIPGDGVAFSMARSIDAIALMLGILKAGAIMIPIDASYPLSRIDFILDDSFAKLYVVDDFFNALLMPVEMTSGAANADRAPGTNPRIAADGSPRAENSLLQAIASGKMAHAEEGCYCLYTSGSTGQPKGVLVPHRGILNLVLSTSIYEGFDEISRIAFSTTFTFDVAMQEIFTALLNGRTGVILPERRNTSVDEIVQQMVHDKVDLLFSTPTYFSALTSNESNAYTLLNHLKLVCLAGEKFFLNDTVKRLQKEGKCQTRFDNQYGPVELSVISSTRHMADDDFTSIGLPIPNMVAYILDEDGNVCAQGEKGELVFAGRGVALGYLNHPELTEVRFVANPVAAGVGNRADAKADASNAIVAAKGSPEKKTEGITEKKAEGAAETDNFVEATDAAHYRTVYKTGDLAYLGEDGEIHYVGRNDFQVKLRGQRIELEEIESVLLKNDGVKNAAVVVQEFGGKQVLCAFYEKRSVLEAEEDFQENLRRHLRAAVPVYMVPDRFYCLKALPVLPSGKVDRNTLTAMKMEDAGKAEERAVAPPATVLEETIVRLMQEVLMQGKIGANEDFFELGADSLNIIEFVAELKGKGVLVGIQDVFDARNARALAALIEKTNGAAAGGKAGTPVNADAAVQATGSDKMASVAASVYDTQTLTTPTDASEDVEFASALTKFLAENKRHLESAKTTKNTQEGRGMQRAKSTEGAKSNQNTESAAASQPVKPPVFFLTGATGFLGAHVLHELVERTSSIIYCLVRANSPEEAAERLRGRYEYYFQQPLTALTIEPNKQASRQSKGDACEESCLINVVKRAADNKSVNEKAQGLCQNRARVYVLHGNLEEDKFGLDEGAIKTLQETVDCIINCSANVRYYGSLESFEKINTEPVKNFINLVRSASKPIHLLHISTVSVAGSGAAETPVFTEADFFANQTFKSAYARSKFEAEKILLQEMLGGFDATIVRLGNLLHRAEDAQFQPNINTNSLMRHVQALAAVGSFPASFNDLRIEMSPVDKVAEAVTSLSLSHGLASGCSRKGGLSACGAPKEWIKARVLNLTNPHMIPGSLLIEALRKNGFPMEEKTDKAFKESLMSLQETPRLRGQAAYLLGGISDGGTYSPDPDTSVSSVATARYMKTCGFSWNLENEKYVYNLVKNLIEIGFLEKRGVDKNGED